MNMRLEIVLVAGLMLLPCSAEAASIVFSFDESGAGLLHFSNPDHTDKNNGVRDKDPLAANDGLPAGTLVLKFTLPNTVQTGSVVVQEQGNSTAINDLLYFTGRTLWVYSEKGDTDDPAAIADVGIPAVASIPTPLVTMQEVGHGQSPDKMNDIFYVPNVGQPGFDTANALSYHFVSDPTGTLPEPASLIMLGTGVSIGGLVWHRRRRRMA